MGVLKDSSGSESASIAGTCTDYEYEKAITPITNPKFSVPRGTGFSPLSFDNL